MIKYTDEIYYSDILVWSYYSSHIWLDLITIELVQEGNRPQETSVGWVYNM